MCASVISLKKSIALTVLDSDFVYAITIVFASEHDALFGHWPSQ